MPDQDARPSAPVILLAIAQEWFARSFETILTPKGFTVLKRYTGRDALEVATQARPDAIILDADLPEIDGLAVCRRLRAEGRVSDSTPILLMTSGPVTRQQRLDALRAGACDFRSQPVDPEEFMLRLDSYVRCKMDADRMRDNGLVDPGSGLYNLSGLLRRTREVLADSARRRVPAVCVAFAPHPGVPDGDRLAAAFRKHGRASDVVARLGQAEFAIVAEDGDNGKAERLVERVTRAVEGEIASVARLRVGQHTVQQTPEAGVDELALVESARSALREAIRSFRRP